MAFALDATVSGPEANSYLTEAEASDILAVRRYGVWDAATTGPGGDRELALVAATEDIDAQIFNGL